jgi:hypothetical protein
MQAALRMEGLDIWIELIRVADNDDAVRREFLGSPSFRLNDVDL